MLMKVGSKRRRTKQDITDQRNEDQIRAKELEAKWARIEKMEQELEASKEQANNFKSA